MNTTEQNILIADFMGAKRLNKFFELPQYERLTHVRYSHECEDSDLFTAEELQYHVSFDWLMPVVKKISELEFHNLLPFEYLNMVTLRINSPIVEVYGRVIRFIEWADNNPLKIK